MDYNVIDLHCDSLTKSYNKSLRFLEGEMHLSLDHLPERWRWTQCMAVFIPDELRGKAARDYFEMVHTHYRRLLVEHPSLLTGVEDIDTIGEMSFPTPFAAVLTVEGGAVLEGDPANVRELFEKGVRMMTLTWNAANELCGGVASGGGFTPVGREAVRQMERCGMIVDVSHLSDEGFWELCDFAGRSFVASHSNSRAVCPHRRNLTDDMFREIVRRGGLVGLNYYDLFITDGGGSTDIGDLMRHIHHFLELGGESTLALGSDYDGAEIPAYLLGVESIGGLAEAMERSGIPDQTIRGILGGNAARFFRQFRIS